MMDAALRKAIEGLMDSAEFARKILDEHSFYERHPMDRQPEPNDAMTARDALAEDIAALKALLPKEGA